MTETTTGDKATDALIRLTDDARYKYENPANAGVERDARAVRDALADRITPELARTFLAWGPDPKTQITTANERKVLLRLARIAEQDGTTA
jgi:hypothetical protein